MAGEPSLVVLVGPRAVGKTTLGRALALELGGEAAGWPFSDADEVLAARVGRPAGETLQEVGETEFRRLEESVVVPLIEASSGVLALGGGAVLSVEVRRALARRRDALVVHLDAPRSAQVERQRGDTTSVRPRLAGSTSIEDEVARIDVSRRPLYSAVSDARIDTAATGSAVSALAALVRRG